jgi:hypothetical protein
VARDQRSLAVERRGTVPTSRVAATVAAVTLGV